MQGFSWVVVARSSDVEVRDSFRPTHIKKPQTVGTAVCATRLGPFGAKYGDSSAALRDQNDGARRGGYCQSTATLTTTL